MPFSLDSAVLTVNITQKMFKGECPGILKADQFYYLKNRHIPIPLQINKQLQVVHANSVCPPSLLQSIYYLMSLPLTKENAF